MKQIAGDSLEQSSSKDGIVTINYKITSPQTVLSIGSKLKVIILNRNVAFDFWTPSWEDGSAIIKSPYLIRSAALEKGVLALKGDLNQTEVTAEVWADDNVKSVSFNGKKVNAKTTDYGSFKFSLKTSSNLKVKLPDLQKLDWVSTTTAGK